MDSECVCRRGPAEVFLAVELYQETDVLLQIRERRRGVACIFPRLEHAENRSSSSFIHNREGGQLVTQNLPIGGIGIALAPPHCLALLPYLSNLGPCGRKPQKIWALDPSHSIHIMYVCMYALVVPQDYALTWRKQDKRFFAFVDGGKSNLSKPGHCRCSVSWGGGFVLRAFSHRVKCSVDEYGDLLGFGVSRLIACMRPCQSMVKRRHTGGGEEVCPITIEPATDVGLFHGTQLSLATPPSTRHTNTSWLNVV